MHPYVQTAVGDNLGYVYRYARVCVCGRIFGGREQKADGAPVCVIGDKMGCGVEHRSNGKRIVFFTHNSKSVSIFCIAY